MVSRNLSREKVAMHQIETEISTEKYTTVTSYVVSVQATNMTSMATFDFDRPETVYRVALLISFLLQPSSGAKW